MSAAVKLSAFDAMLPKLKVCSLLLVLALSACGGEEFQDLRQWVKNSGQDMRGKVEPLPEVKPYEPFSYTAFDMPDPFKPRKLVPKFAGGGLQPDLARRKEVLEAFPLEGLKMVGTLQQKKAMYALIKSPEGNLVRVKVGDHMGQNFGRVTAISDSEIKLKELAQEITGEWVEREATLQLIEEQEKKDQKK